MEIEKKTTSDLLSELITRDGVDYEKVNAGQEYNYRPPKDGYFIIVPIDAIPHKPTIKEQFMTELLERYKKGEESAGKMMVEILNGRW